MLYEGGVNLGAKLGIKAGTYEKESKISNSIIHIKLGLTQLAKPFYGRVRPAFWYLGHYGIMGNWTQIP